MSTIPKQLIIPAFLAGNKTMTATLPNFFVNKSNRIPTPCIHFAYPLHAPPVDCMPTTTHMPSSRACLHSFTAGLTCGAQESYLKEGACNKGSDTPDHLTPVHRTILPTNKKLLLHCSSQLNLLHNHAHPKVGRTSNESIGLHIKEQANCMIRLHPLY